MNSHNNFRAAIPDKKKIIIKIGTSSLTHENGKINLHFMDLLIRQISDLKNKGYQIVLVSSGAVAAGLPALGLVERPSYLPYKQAAAAVGQGILMHLYERFFRDYGQVTAQVLLTKGDSLNPKRYFYARGTLCALLELGAIPIVNENDAVTVDEIKIGDNDTLSAAVASIIDADLLIILSDIDGLYTTDPVKNPEADLISEVDVFEHSLFDFAGGPGSSRGTGGMYTKLLAAEICTNSGIDMVIASSGEPDVLYRIMNGETIGTFFKGRDVHPQMKQRALIIGADVKGKVFVDEGCREALLHRGSSLLPVGMTGVEGEFSEGDTVSICFGDEEIGRGIAHYSTEEAGHICRCHTGELKEALGFDPPYDTFIHRDNLVITR